MHGKGWWESSCWRHILAVGEGKGAAGPTSETGSGKPTDGAGRQGRTVRIPPPCSVYSPLMALTLFQMVSLPSCFVCVFSHSVVSDSLRPHGLYPARLLRLWDSPDKNAGVGGHFLLQGIFSTHRWNTCLLPWQVDSWPTKLTEKPLSLSLVMYHLKFFLEAEL